MEIIETEFEYGKYRENELYGSGIRAYYKKSKIESIIENEELSTSVTTLNPFTEKKQKCVCFRDYLKSDEIGVIFNLKKLSERYEILYYSNVEECRKHGIYVHRVVAYSDNTYQRDRQNIDRDIYEIIRNEFATQSQEVIKEKNIIHSHKGKTKKKDVTVKEIFSCNLRDVTLNIPAERFTLEQLYRISKKDCPIIFLKDDKQYLDISECISGLYCNTRMYDPDEKIISFMIECLRPLCEKYHKNLKHEHESYFPYITEYYTLCD